MQAAAVAAGLLALVLTPRPARAQAQTPQAGAVQCTSSGTVRCETSVDVREPAPDDRWQPLDAASLSSDVLRAFGGDVPSWIAAARLQAGSPIGVERVYVDGLPSGSDVPASLVSRVSVNRDPFSVEFSAVGEIRVDLDLAVPDRRWRINSALPSLQGGGVDPLTGARGPKIRTLSIDGGGPIPGLPLTFSLQGGRSSTESQPAFASPITARTWSMDEAAIRGSVLTNARAEIVFGSPRAVVRSVFAGSRLQITNGGTGGITAAESAYRSTDDMREMQTSWRLANQQWRHRGGVSWHAEEAATNAITTAAARVATGQHVAGGNEVARQGSRTQRILLTHVAERRVGGHPAMIGATVMSDTVSREYTPNPNGRWQLETPASKSGVLFLRFPRSPVSVRTSTAAVFADRVMVSTDRVSARAGLRADWQQGDGVLVSPRVNVSFRFRGYTFSGGAGRFVDGWSSDLLADIDQRDEGHLDSFIVPDVALSDAEVNRAGGIALRTLRSATFTRRRDVVVKAGAQRQLGRVTLGAEQTWTEGRALGGMVRAWSGASPASLVDLLASERSLSRQQSHVRAAIAGRRGSASINYQYIRSFDDAPGLFVAPARAGDPAGEWARSTAVARHHVSVVATLALPREVRLSATASTRSSLPFNVITGRDEDGLFTFTDRGGLMRNSGDGPAFKNVSVYASRRFPWPGGGGLDVGCRVDNLLDSANPTGVGTVSGSPLFGQPLGGSIGRTFRVWVVMGR